MLSCRDIEFETKTENLKSEWSHDSRIKVKK